MDSDDAAGAPSEKEKTRRMIDVLAHKFARNRRLQSVLDKDDYLQSAHVRILSDSRAKGRPLTDAETYAAAKQAMIEEKRRVSIAVDRLPRLAEDPLRPTVAKPTATGETLDALDALQVLDDDERAIALKRFWEGKSGANISAETGEPKHRIDRKGGRAVKKLRAHLEPAYAEEYARKHPKRYGNKIYGSHYSGRTP